MSIQNLNLKSYSVAISIGFTVHLQILAKSIQNFSMFHYTIIGTFDFWWFFSYLSISSNKTHTSKILQSLTLFGNSRPLFVFKYHNYGKLEAVKEASTVPMKEIPITDFLGALNDWIKRWQCCIEAEKQSFELWLKRQNGTAFNLENKINKKKWKEPNLLLLLFSRRVVLYSV